MVRSQMPDANLATRIKEGMQEQKEALNLAALRSNTDKGTAFEHYVAKLIGIAESEENWNDPSEWPTGGKDDLECDLILEDIDSKRMLIVQTKYKAVGKDVDAQDYQKTLDAWRKHINPAVVSTGNAQVKDKLADFKTRINEDGWSVVYRYVTPAKFKATAIKAFSDEYEKAAKVLSSAMHPIEFEYYDGDKLKDYILDTTAIEATGPQFVTFGIDPERLIELEGPYESLLAIIRAKELVQLYLDGARQSLYNSNIRCYLGDSETLKVNKAIRESANKNPDLFYYLNNGLSALCENYTLNYRHNGSRVDKMPIGELNNLDGLGSRSRELLDDLIRENDWDVEEGGADVDKTLDELLPGSGEIGDTRSNFLAEVETITAEQFQIINGAQTLSSLAAPDVTVPDELLLTLKLTKIDEVTTAEGFGEKIVRANNRQNQLTDEDFISNHPLQIWLHNNLINRDERIEKLGTFYYKNKRVHPKPAGLPRKELKVRNFAKMRYAYLQGASVEFSSDGSLLKGSPISSVKNHEVLINPAPEGKYVHAFGEDGVILDSWSTETLDEALYIYAVMKWLEQKTREPGEADPKKEFGFIYHACRYNLIALIGYHNCVSGARKKSELRAIYENGPRFDDIMDDLYEQAKDAVETAVKHNRLVLNKDSIRQSEKVWRESLSVFVTSSGSGFASDSL